jgi:predicted ribosome quality control (RQC) complex YloA/Tae2 family protein
VGKINTFGTGFNILNLIYKKNLIFMLKYSEWLLEGKNKFPNIKEVDVDGFTVYIGKDAKSNDYLTFIIASPEDIWMHVKGVPGSHVIIKVKNHIPDKNIIKKAAEYAKKNSKAKDIKATIVYCKQRFVKKDSTMPDGKVKVDYKNSDEITI